MSSTKTSLSDAHNSISYAKKHLDFECPGTDDEAHRGQARTGRLTFKAYNRQPRDRHERVICQLENGWLKESPQRYKFYTSAKKTLGRRLVDVVMHRELKQAMSVLEIEEIMDNV